MRNKCLLAGSVWMICFLMGSAVPVQAQHSVKDSLNNASPPLSLSDDTHTLKWKEVVVPAALIGVSALYVENGWLKKQRLEVQDALSGKGKHKFKADDYIQYAPMVAAYGLDFVGIKARHSLKDRTILLAMSYATMGIAVHSMKFAFNEKRPDTNATNSFPSGHTATAFMGAQYLYEEYKDVSPWIGYAGYAVATATGYLRIYNHRHYFNDVIAGACIGILSTKFAYWLYPKLFKKSDCARRMNVVGLPYYSGEGVGLNMSMTF